ncbi:AI-2E family transporter [Candidatus Pacearchaeota archaeon]|nr:AI-2E family transporter [Candidatus Pacearchaeota archaeon]
MRKEWIHRYLPIVILLVLVTVSFIIIKDYVIAIIGAFITTYLIYPIHRKLERKMPPWLAAGITLTGTILIIFLPLFVLIKEVINQIYRAIQSGSLAFLISKIENLEIIKQYNLNLSDVTNNFFSFGINTLSSITLSVATSIVSLFVMIFIIYYLLLSWPKLCSRIRNYVPFEKKDKVIKDMSNTTKKIVKGTLFLAFIQSLVAALGFWLAGIDFYLILAALIGLFAFIPGGPAVVWVPTLIIKIIQQDYISAGIILVFGLFTSIYLDTILRTRVAGKDSGIHPAIMLLGVMGGVPLLGLTGIVVGPLLLSYTLEILEEILSEH